MCGLRKEATQRRLLLEDRKLQFTKAVEMAQSIEAVEKHSIAM